MICRQCANDADGVIERHTWCSVCHRQIQVYSTGSRIIMTHKAKGPDGSSRVKCPGSGKHALIVGHAACTGCDCHHHPVGTRQQKT